MTLHLTQSFSAAPEGTFGSLHLQLHNLGHTDLKPVSFCYTSLARIDDTTDIVGGTLVETEGSFVQIVPRTDLPAGEAWKVDLLGLVHRAHTRTQGVLTAWITLQSGDVIEATVSDLEPRDGADRGSGKHWPNGSVKQPLALLPWPAEVAVDVWDEVTPTLFPAPGTDPCAFHRVATLHRRLFPADPAPIALEPEQYGRAVSLKNNAGLPQGGYRLTFKVDVTLAHADEDGLRHGLIALAQIAHAARIDARFSFPKRGYIADHPRHDWRGLMLDVVRNFFPVSTNLRMLDIMAWLRMNRFHWHITDDEGWRMPSRAFPALNTVGASRGPGQPMPPQYGDGPKGSSGFYTEADIAQVIDHATSLGIAVMPEIEMPGHAKSMMAAIPGLLDANESNDAYRSIQGHTNNALNPGLPRTYEVIETLLDEAIALFPFDIIHLGADEVELSAWTKSPSARAFADKHGLSGTHELQSHFLCSVQTHLAKRGRHIGAWDEAAEGGGVKPDTALLFAWRSRERIAELIELGYDVVALPGQAYYLDMIESAGWDAQGASWAGLSTPENCYAYEAADALPDGPGRLVGVQAAIWTEYLNTEAAINALAFPRIAAVAEAAWTPAEEKDWTRFCALSRLVPQL